MGVDRPEDDVEITPQLRAQHALFLWSRLGEGNPEGLSAGRPGQSPSPGYEVEASQTGLASASSD